MRALRPALLHRGGQAGCVPRSREQGGQAPVPFLRHAHERRNRSHREKAAFSFHAVVQLFLVGPLTLRWGETRLIRLSLVSSAVGFVAMLLAGDFTGLLVTATLFVMANSLARPLVTTLISKAATGGQGQAMGLNNSFMSLGQTVGPTWSGYALDYNLMFPFSSGAAIMLISLITTYKGFKMRAANSLV